MTPKRKVFYVLLECPKCHDTLRLTLKKRQVKEVLKGKRETVEYHVEVIQ